jgi:hypothetical protein
VGDDSELKLTLPYLYVTGVKSPRISLQTKLTGGYLRVGLTLNGLKLAYSGLKLKLKLSLVVLGSAFFLT